MSISKPKPKVWKKVDEINIQKVYHCDNPACKYKGIEIAISFIHEGRHKLQHCTNCGLQHCTNCGHPLSFSHIEVRS